MMCFFLQPESYTQDLDHADNEQTDNNETITKSNNHHNGVSKWVLKEPIADTWFNSWEPTEHAGNL